MHTVSIQSIENKIYQSPDSNLGLPLLQATALPTEPHNHCPIRICFWGKINFIWTNFFVEKENFDDWTFLWQHLNSETNSLEWKRERERLWTRYTKDQLKCAERQTDIQVDGKKAKNDEKPERGQWLCGLVGRAVASDTRSPRFESSHRQKFIYIEHLFTVNCVLKRRK